MKRYAVDIPVEIYEGIRKMSKKYNISIREIIQSALENELRGEILYGFKTNKK